MDYIWWALIIILFLVSFIGIVMPIIPGLPLIWAGLLIYHFGIGQLTGWNFWVTIILLSILVIIVDYIASSAWVRRYGGSRLGAFAAFIGILIGPFLLGPIGVILGPFIAVTVAELIRGFKLEKAIKIGIASIIGFLGGSVFKVILQAAMIGVFLLKLWWT